MAEAERGSVLYESKVEVRILGKPEIVEKFPRLLTSI